VNKLLVNSQLSLATQNSLLYLGDGLGNLDASRAGFGAVEGGATAPDTFFIVQDV
jgi:hypothetical protein